MAIHIDKPSRQQLIFLSMILMLTALFTSRFLLSVSFILFLAFTCVHKDFPAQLRSFSRNRFLLGMCLLFFIPFTSWFWTEDKEMWMRFARIKLPLFLFPLAFAGRWQLSSRQWKWLAYSFLLLVFAGCCWSFWQYVQHRHEIHDQYLRAKIFATPLENDHVRFSLVVSVAVICAVVLMKQYLPAGRWPVFVLCSIFLVVYLHVLSARTGLISLYISLAACILYLLVQLKKRKWLAGLILLLLAMPLVAWFLFPTFQNRIRYNLYDLSNVRQNKYVPGSNDGNRILSMKAGWAVLKENPLGVGGDVVDKTYDWYNMNLPRMQDSDKLFPASEPLMYAGFAGWPGLILFVLAMLLPFFEHVQRNYFFWAVLNFVMAFSFLFDIGLEAQFGVFIYAFIVLWWWKWFNYSSQPKP